MFFISLILKWKRSSCPSLTTRFGRKCFETPKTEMLILHQRDSKVESILPTFAFNSLDFFSRKLFSAPTNFIHTFLMVIVVEPV